LPAPTSVVAGALASSSHIKRATTSRVATLDKSVQMFRTERGRHASFCPAACLCGRGRTSIHFKQSGRPHGWQGKVSRAPAAAGRRHANQQPPDTPAPRGGVSEPALPWAWETTSRQRPLFSWATIPPSLCLFH
jgi:hypothetical protein